MSIKVKNIIKQKQQFNRKIQIIKYHADTKVVTHNEYKSAYEYVDLYFPFSNIKQISITLCSKQALKAVQIEGVAGFYYRIDKTIVVCKDIQQFQSEGVFSDIQAAISIDEVIVHQMLHYVSHLLGRNMKTHTQQQFAYGNSVPYLLSKGYSQQYIVRSIFLPYLISSIDISKYIKKSVSSASYNSMSDERKLKLVQQVLTKKKGVILNQAMQIGKRWVQKYKTIHVYQITNTNNKPQLDI